jgi:hypothetical protein
VTDIWCFTCRHELKPVLLSDRYTHLDPDDVANGCVCTEDGLECQP